MRRVPTALVPRRLPPEAVPLEPERAAAVARLAAGARGASTNRAYAWGWGVFERWCAMEGRIPLPADAETIKSFVASQVARVPAPAWASLGIQLAAVSTAHRHARCWNPVSDPDLHDVLTGARRALGVAARAPKAPAAEAELEAMIAGIDRTTLEGKRDAAVLLVGFHSALRRSNLAALECADFSPTPGGLAIHIRRSKTDQTGEGRVIGIAEHGGPLCAVEALREWWQAAGITDGLAFRAFAFDGVTVLDHFGARTVERIVQRYAAAAGLNPRRFGGHSLRAGFVTEAIRRGAGDAEIMGTTLHASANMLVRYRREADPVARGASRRMKLGKDKAP